MTVTHNNVQHLLEVNPGEAGRLEFQANIRRIFGLGVQDVISLSFGCKAPGTGELPICRRCLTLTFFCGLACFAYASMWPQYSLFV